MSPPVRSFLRLSTLLFGLIFHAFEFCSQSRWHGKDVIIRIIFVVRKLVAVGMLRGRIIEDLRWADGGSSIAIIFRSSLLHRCTLLLRAEDIKATGRVMGNASRTAWTERRTEAERFRICSRI